MSWPLLLLGAALLFGDDDEETVSQKTHEPAGEGETPADIAARKLDKAAKKKEITPHVPAKPKKED